MKQQKPPILKPEEKAMLKSMIGIMKKQNAQNEVTVLTMILLAWFSGVFFMAAALGTYKITFLFSLVGLLAVGLGLWGMKQ